MFLALLKGFATSASLIVAIGAQNAFVIRQGLLRRHLLLTALVCSIIDAVLIMVGVLGFGKILLTYPFLVVLTKYFAVTFLFLYGLFSIKSAFATQKLEDHKKHFASAKKTILLLLALSLLNPHVYLDTVILLGSIASQQPLKEQMYFGFGAIGASFVWFFFLTYGSRFLAPLLRKPYSWKIIDLLIALTMWGIGLSLLITL